VEGRVAEEAEGSGKCGVAEELDEGSFGGVDAGGDQIDGPAVEDDGAAVGMQGAATGFDAAGAGGGFALAGGAADGKELGDAEFGVDIQGECLEGAVGAEELGETAARGVERGEEVGRKGAVGGGTGEEPFEGEARVEGEELAEAEGEFFVAHEGGVGDGDTVVGEVSFETRGAGADAFGAGGQGGVAEGVVERGFEVGQAGAETESDGEGTGDDGSVGVEFGGGGRAAQGGRGGALFAEALAAAEFAEEKASGVGGEESGKGDGGDGEGGGDGDDAVVGEVGDEFAGEEGGVGGLFEGVAEEVHGGKSGGNGGECQGFP
jgi:hypothetical protein